MVAAKAELMAVTAVEILLASELVVLASRAVPRLSVSLCRVCRVLAIRLLSPSDAASDSLAVKLPRAYKTKGSKVRKVLVTVALSEVEKAEEAVVSLMAV